ncbi:MAG: Holliday junction branch migration protein RuvA [Bacteroides sp.]|nr:Holliday junction branch migration protein RuvA [Bacteroides sp.]MBD5333242.1 Holliday junction branch migration protein RuvA [Bacteroides sp.]
MLEYIKGIITENTPTYVVVEAGNLGYLINIPLSTFSRLQNCSGEIKLWLHQVIREDAWTLYGFFTTRERELFRLLIGVSGVGPGTASLILSSLSPAELELTISSGDHSRLKGVKGIGAKTAQRIIVDLKDKIKPSEETLLLSGDAILPASNSEVYEEALAALTVLGYPRPACQKALRRIFDADPAIKVEAAIKQAFTMM